MGAVGLALFLQLAARAVSPSRAAALMMLALFFGRMQTAGFWVNMVDVCPESAAALMGLSNCLATLPGILGQPATQAILESTGSWPLVFGAPNLLGIVTSLVYVALGDDMSLDAPPVVKTSSKENSDGLCCVVGADGPSECRGVRPLRGGSR